MAVGVVRVVGLRGCKEKNTAQTHAHKGTRHNVLSLYLSLWPTQAGRFAVCSRRREGGKEDGERREERGGEQAVGEN